MGSPDDFNRVMSVNAKGAFFIARELQSKFTADARVLYLTSSVGEAYKVPYPFYAISKKALNMVYEVMKKELKGILVAAVHPGLVKTDMYHVQVGKIPGFNERIAIDPSIAAKFLKFILSEKVNAKEYSDEIWSIYNLHHQPRWLEEGDEAPGQQG
ncbi:unnamed protein product [Blepharisma stoltei]|uniref:Uncharacterized protein n=1 Tax=Blepharisma stoltei TaxID=1481888 RepID=A0AAU9J866_9CILI|nr:unnamed protein product [Blepharisma stoltei]